MKSLKRTQNMKIIKPLKITLKVHEKMASYEDVKAAIEKIRPSLLQDGGDVELVDFKEDKVYLRLLGHCRGCPYSMMTLKNGIERYLKEQIDPNLEVINVN